MMDASAHREAWRGTPVASIQDLTGNAPILIVAPHPDDESIGCGGIIALARDAGISVTIAVLTDGSASHPGSVSYPPSRLAEVRQRELVDAIEILGVSPDRLFAFGRKDGALDPRDPQLEQDLVALIERYSIRSIFAPWDGDSHPDHRAAYNLSLTAARRTSLSLWAYPVWGLIHDVEKLFKPTVRVNISSKIALKRAAIAQHRSQFGHVVSDSLDPFQISDAQLDRFTQPFEAFARITLV